MPLNQDRKVNLLRDEKIPKALLKLGLPTMVGMLVSALYNVVDAYFVGGLGTSQMGAVSVVFPVGQVVIGIGMTFGSGSASYLSRLLGEGNKARANATASTALFTGLAAGTFALAGAFLFMDPLLTALGATETILPPAREYAAIYLAGAILTVFNVMMNNIVTAEGAAKLTMTAMLTGGALNAVLDPLFIYTFGWGIGGAAAATVTAQALTSLIYFRYLIGRKSCFRFSPRLVSADTEIHAEIFKVGLPTLVFQLLTSLAIGSTNSAAGTYGDGAVAAVGIVTRLSALGTFVVFGYMKGFQPLAGFNYGAKNYVRLREATRVSLKWSFRFCGTAAAVMIIFASPIVSLFSANDRTVVVLGSRALRANGVMFFLFGFQMMYMSLFLALGKAKEGGILSIGRQGLFFLPLIVILPRFFGLDGVIYAQPAADLLTTALAAVLALKLGKTLAREEAAAVR